MTKIIPRLCHISQSGHNLLELRCVRMEEVVYELRLKIMFNIPIFHWLKSSHDATSMERLGKVSWVKKTEEMCLVRNNLCDYCRAVYTHSFLTLWNPMDQSLLGSTIYGILQARILECIAISSTRVSSQPRDHTPVSCISCTAGGLFTTELSGTPLWLLHNAFTFFIFFFLFGVHVGISYRKKIL